MTRENGLEIQKSRVGKSAITIFVPTESKNRIRAALADAGYGISFQVGIIALIDELLVSQGRQGLQQLRKHA